MSEDFFSGVDLGNPDAICEYLLEEFQRMTEGWPSRRQNALALRLASGLAESAAIDSGYLWSSKTLDELVQISAQLEKIALHGNLRPQH
ncbi:hypothetical protein ACT3G6_11310 [Actibacterium sp. D379-3]